MSSAATVPDLSGTVELSILCAPQDLDFLEPTLRGMLRCFDECPHIANRVLILDLGGAPSPGSDALVAVAERLRREGKVDELRPVDWDPARVAASMGRWFGDPSAPPSAARRRAVHQYGFSVDSARTPFVLHVDSDMFFHGDAGWWLDEACGRLVSDAAVAAVVPNAAVPRARRGVEWLLGRRLHRRRWASGWHDGPDITSRAVLLHRQRVLDALPLERVGDEQWESSLSRALARQGRCRSTLVDDRFFMLHPLGHNRAHARHAGGLVRLVESGRIPFRRFGKPWDITTEGWRFLPWLLRLRLQTVRGRT